MIFNGGLIKAQGCSDAGFCTVNSLKPHSNDSISLYKNQFKAGLSVGKADHSITVYSPYLEYNREINSQWGISVKVAALSQSGNGVSTFGVSDVYVNTNYRLDQNLSFTLGTKIPLANGNKMKDGQPLPMDYQSSLGTLDLIAGIGYQIKKLQLVAAIQQPLTQNSNQFVAENTPANSIWRDFQTTKDFKRSGDILFRASYPIKITDKFLVTPGLLNIYHLSDDQFSTISGTEQKIEGSKGLTINGNLFLDYVLNKKQALQLSIGAPFLVRDTRPDGLTRSFLGTLEYRFNF
ncbi:hypothetical protein ACM46_19600 [Chryseobacterium angstadtii]|uniref:Uncharacterized protein n=2 Tax=Chryseobacterium angstadtii TaxID=558151 RepID=A0A0J7I1D5_9FLAO|nr:hypothetical protein ACM46_19600 [Chryseobacterium angstadtii]